MSGSNFKRSILPLRILVKRLQTSSLYLQSIGLSRLSTLVSKMALLPLLKWPPERTMISSYFLPYLWGSLIQDLKLPTPALELASLILKMICTMALSNTRRKNMPPLFLQIRLTSISLLRPRAPGIGKPLRP